MPQVPRGLALADTALLTLLLASAFTLAYTYSKIAYLKRELNAAREKLTSLEHYIDAVRDVKAAPREVEGIFSSDKIYLYLFYGCGCNREVFERSLEEWRAAASRVELVAQAYSFRSQRGMEEYTKLHEKLGDLPEGDPLVIVARGSTALVFTTRDMSVITEAIERLSQGEIEEPKLEESSQPMALSAISIAAIGAISGINPCLIALLAFIASATAARGGSLKKVVWRVAAISLGVFYTYLVFGYVIYSSEQATRALKALAIPLAAILASIGALHVAEALLELRSKLHAAGGEPVIPLFKTPAMLKSLIREIGKLESTALDFTLGAVFSLVKLPCVAPIYLLVVYKSIAELKSSLAYMLSYSAGTVIPTFTLGALIAAGILEISSLTKLRAKARVAQRATIGALLIASAALLI